MINILYSKISGKKKGYVIEYRWKVDNIDTLWVVYKKFKNKVNRDKEFESLIIKNKNSDFTEFTKKTILY